MFFSVATASNNNGYKLLSAQGMETLQIFLREHGTECIRQFVQVFLIFIYLLFYGIFIIHFPLHKKWILNITISLKFLIGIIFQYFYVVKLTFIKMLKNYEFCKQKPFKHVSPFYCIHYFWCWSLSNIYICFLLLQIEQ